MTLPVLHIKHNDLQSLFPPEFDYVSMTEEDFDVIELDEREVNRNTYKRPFSAQKSKKCFG